MQGRAAFRLNGFENRASVESFTRKDHGCAVRHASQVRQHHSEAVVKRHRDAQPVHFAEAQAFAGEETIIQDVVMGKYGALWRAGGSARELNIDRVIKLQRVRQLADSFALGGSAAK